MCISPVHAMDHIFRWTASLAVLDKEWFVPKNL